MEKGSPGAPKRLLSLDAFRGLTIAAMILVNNAGDWGRVYAPLRHAAWHGWTLADLVFPFFVFILGSAIPLSLGHRLDAGEPRRRIVLSVCRRAVILLLLGLVLNLVPEFDFNTVRIPGVLQRIGLSYLAGAMVFMATRRPTLWGGAAVALMALHWAVLKLVAVPGFGAGVLEPLGNAAWYIDSTLFAGHTYKLAPAPGFDPEGLLDTLSSAATVLFGMLAGRWMRAERMPQERFRGLFAAANIMLGVGLILNVFLPINKNLWTPAFTVFTSGIALYAMLAFYRLVDIKGRALPGRPLQALGANALAIYALSSLTAKILVSVTITGADGAALPLKTIIFKALFVSWMGPYAASLAYAVMNLILWLGLALVLFRKNIFIRV